MNEKIYECFRLEIDLGRKAATEGRREDSWRHLERAHIIGQKVASLHFGSHFEMLRLALRCRDFKEAFGQAVRLVLAPPSSFFGFAPPGNSGRAETPLRMSMPLPRDLEWVAEENRRGAGK